MSNDMITVSADSARRWAATVLECAGVSAEQAVTVARGLVLADLRGVDSHGLNRLPGYAEGVRRGAINPSPSLAFAQKSPVMALLDAQHTFGFVAASMAVEHGIEMARTFGIGIVGVRNSTHFGIAAAYCLQAMEQGFAVLCFTNASPAMPAWGSKQPLWGTNPTGIGFPGGSKGDFLLDTSTSIVARSKVRRAARRGERIPEGWMLDAQGRSTTDPNEALKGTILPIGGPKGAGLAAMVDIFSGLLTGSSFAGDVLNSVTEPDKRPGTGHWFMVFKPEMFLDSREEYLERMDTLVSKVRDSERAEGVTRVLVPGERSAEIQSNREREGIPYRKTEIEALHKLAEGLGCSAKLA